MLAVMEKCFLKIYHKFGFIETIRRCLLRALSMLWCPFMRSLTSKKPLLPAAAEAGAKEVFCWCAWHGHNDLAMKYQSGLDSRNC